MQGLTKDQVLKSRSEHGSNVITPPKKRSALKLFLEKFNDPIIKILIVAAMLSVGISFVHMDFIETVGIVLAIFLSVSIGFWFEYDAERKFDILNTIGDEAPVRVIRDWHVTCINKKDVVVGDLVMLESGEEVPADGHLIESLSLGINESSLTGESFVRKSAKAEERECEATYPTNMVYRGTTVMEGNGIMEVERVGDATEYGHMAIASTVDSGEKTPLVKQLDKLAAIISVIGATVAFTVFTILLVKYLANNAEAIGRTPLITLGIVVAALMVLAFRAIIPLINNIVERFRPESRGLRQGKRWPWYLAALIVLACGLAILSLSGVNILSGDAWLNVDTLSVLLDFFMVAVSLIVMAVPEGLPMSITLSLALNMRRMLKSNNLVRKMHASETMGAINVICTDKTGTLTQNRMTVSDMIIPDGIDKTLLYEGIAMNSTSHLDYTETGEIRPVGNPTESALLVWLSCQGVDYNIIRDSHAIIDQSAFSSERKSMMALVNSKVKEGARILYIKGAPEKILAKSALTDTERAAYEEMLAVFQNEAKRTLAFGYAVVEGDNCDAIYDNTTFTFMGLTAITDPVREDVPAAIAKCVSAGITVKIVTGDTPATAIEIARRIGLWKEGDSKETHHITGSEFAELSDEELEKRIMSFKIISRARPIDKQRLVQALQKRGFVTAVTGDGTNDAPALNFAHVGLSMGSGTAVAKEASDITIIDDSFGSISTAVMWGRSLYRNIQRFLLFQLSINVIALGVFIVGVILGTEPPLTITQILWVNIIMDTIAAAALASLPPVQSVMKDKPRREGDFIISPLMASNIFGFGAAMIVILSVFLYLLHIWYDDGTLIQTIFFTTFVMVQFWNMFNAKVFESGHMSAFKNMRANRVFFYVAGLIILGQLLIVNLGGEMFSCTPLSPLMWAMIVGCTSLVLIIGEAARFIRRLRAKNF